MPCRRAVRLAALLAALSSSHASALDIYWGTTAGLMRPDAGGGRPALNLGGYLGLPLAFFAGVPLLQGLAVEAEGTVTALEGEEANGRDFSVAALGGYVVWRSAGPWYVKARAGLLAERVQVGGGEADDYGASGGIGFGRRLADGGALEIGLTQIERDLVFLSVGFTY
ncbi:MAG TPA: hypothetical protein VNL72_01020 [Gammaproteobacteria bacterium]|nr:hypothetical protein [Gammaproteobacteria bacterium]